MRYSSVIRVLVAAGIAVAVVAPARAEIGTIDDVPAATLLLPYFEVDLNDPLAAHNQMLEAYTDQDMHNVVRYLESLK